MVIIIVIVIIIIIIIITIIIIIQKQPSIDVLIKRCSENIQQIYRRTPMSAISIKLQSNFVEMKFQNGCSPVNLLHIFRATLLLLVNFTLPLKGRF